MKKYFALFFGLVVIALLAGCAGVTTYTVNDQTFYSPEQALAADAEINEGYLKAIQPTPTPVHGKALVAIPSVQEIRRHYFRVSGITREVRDYNCTFLDRGHEYFAEDIRKRGIFDQLTITRADRPSLGAHRRK